MIKILIGGDLCPIGRNESLFRKGDASAIFNGLLSEFQKADFSIVNLECPIIRESSPIKKNGPALGASEDCLNGIRAAGINVLNLANNHIMDHGDRGLENTINLCDKFGINHVGAGENLAAARKIRVCRIDDFRVGILSLAEHEFSIATKNTWGANPLDIIDFVRNVENHRSEFDYLIVLLHGGNEHYPYPRPSLMDTCRFLAEQGADAIICQHSHCPGCYETYRESHIVYGQGNLIMDMPSRYKWFHEGFLVSLRIGQNKKAQMEIIPYVQSDSVPGAHRMELEQEREFRNALEERSRAILNESFIDKQWDVFCRKNRNRYLSWLGGHNSLVRRLDGKFSFLRYFRSRRILQSHLNLIHCESHREALVSILSRESTNGTV